jgi:hypothetical protein
MNIFSSFLKNFKAKRYAGQTLFLVIVHYNCKKKILELIFLNGCQLTRHINLLIWTLSKKMWALNYII